MSERIVFVDLDGVAADFVGHARTVFPAIPTEEQWPLGVYDVAKILGISDADFWTAIHALGEDWWASMPAYPWLDRLMSGASSCGRVVVLSSPARHHGSVAGKVRWLQRHLGADFRDYVLTPAKHKHLLAGAGRILVDDLERNVDGFRRRGNALLFSRPWNSGGLTPDPAGEALDSLRLWAEQS